MSETKAIAPTRAEFKILRRGRYESATDRLMTRSIPEPNSGCWLWLGEVNNKGYGMLSRKESVARILNLPSPERLAHRISYITFVGPVLDRLKVLHRCDVRCCVNPEHLFVGTQRDNMKDCAEKGRYVIKRGAERPNATFTVEDIHFLRSPAATAFSDIELAARYNTDRVSVWRARVGKTYGDIK